MRLPRGLVRVFNRFGNMTSTQRYDEPIPVVVGRVGASPEQVVAVSDQDPLPVVVGASPANPLSVDLVNKETRARNADRLLTSDITVDNNANRDILGNTAADQPTLSDCLQYHTLLWTLFKIGADSINYEILARAVDFSGAPLDVGWRQIATGTITGAANTWHRIVITEPNGLYYDQYRIRVQRGGTADVSQRSVIVGVRR